MIPGIFGAAAWNRGGGIVGDPHWDKVVSYLRFNTTANSSDIIDEKGNDWTSYGAAVINDQEQLFGNNVRFTNSNADYIECDQNWPLESEPFTLDISYRPENLSSNRTLFFNGSPAYAQDSGVLLRASGSGLLFAPLGRENLAAAGVLTMNQWNRIRVCRDSTSTRIYVAGALVAEGVQTDGFSAAAFKARISRYKDSSTIHPLFGRVDEFRLTMGVARTTGASYAVESQEFPNFGP